MSNRPKNMSSRLADKPKYLTFGQLEAYLKKFREDFTPEIEEAYGPIEHQGIYIQVGAHDMVRGSCEHASWICTDPTNGQPTIVVD